jgi:hypothetical protein
MPHPLAVARHLVETYGALNSDRTAALAAIDRLLPFADADTRHCSDCGATFYLTEPQREFFRARQLQEPVRCKGCREQRKAALQTRGLR